MRQYLDAIGIVNIVFGAFQLLLVGLVLLPGLMYGGLGALLAVIGISEGDAEAVMGGVMVGGLGAFMMLPAVFVLAICVLSVSAGYGILRRRKWARVVAIVAAAISMMQCFPLGMLVGIFTIVVLVQPDVGAEFDLQSDAAGD